MSTDRKTLSAHVKDESTLWEMFEEYQQREQLPSKAAAVRRLIETGLEQELGPDENPRRRRREPYEPAEPDVPAVAGNEGLVLGAAFVVGSGGLISALQTVLGDQLGALLFGALGVSIGLLLAVQLWVGRR